MFSLKRKIKKFVACGLAVGSLVGQKVMAEYPKIIGALDGFNVGSKISLTTEKDKELAKIASNSEELTHIFKNYEQGERYSNWIKIGTSGNRIFYALVFGCLDVLEDGTRIMSRFSDVSTSVVSEMLYKQHMNGGYGHKFFEHPHAFANQGLVTVAPDFFVDKSVNRKGETMSLYFKDSLSNWHECPFYSGTGNDLRLDRSHFIVTELNADGETEKVVEWPSEIEEFARMKKEIVTRENNPSTMMKKTNSLAKENGQEITKNSDEKTSSEKSAIGKTMLIGSSVLSVGSIPLILNLLPSADEYEDLTFDLS